MHVVEQEDQRHRSACKWYRRTDSSNNKFTCITHYINIEKTEGVVKNGKSRQQLAQDTEEKKTQHKRLSITKPGMNPGTREG